MTRPAGHDGPHARERVTCPVCGWGMIAGTEPGTICAACAKQRKLSDADVHAIVEAVAARVVEPEDLDRIVALVEARLVPRIEQLLAALLTPETERTLLRVQAWERHREGLCDAYWHETPSEPERPRGFCERTGGHAGDHLFPNNNKQPNKR